MRKESSNVLKAYVGMILDGTAFCNWKNPPNKTQRQIIVENLLGKTNRPVGLDLASVQKLIQTEDEKELQRLVESMEIKEDEFKV